MKKINKIDQYVVQKNIIKNSFIYKILKIILIKLTKVKDIFYISLVLYFLN